jgi:hypothetical protein
MTCTRLCWDLRESHVRHHREVHAGHRARVQDLVREVRARVARHHRHAARLQRGQRGGQRGPQVARDHAQRVLYTTVCELALVKEDTLASGPGYVPHDRSIFATVWTHHPHPAGSIAPLRSRGEPRPAING